MSIRRRDAGGNIVEQAGPMFEKAASFLNPMNLGIIGQGLGVVGDIFGAGKNKTQKWAESSLPGYAKALQTGITEGDVASSKANMMASAMPFINATAAKAGSKFGRSGYARGAGMAAFNQAVTPQLAALLRDRIMNNQANLRSLFGTAASVGANA